MIGSRELKNMIKFGTILVILFWIVLMVLLLRFRIFSPPSHFGSVTILLKQMWIILLFVWIAPGTPIWLWTMGAVDEMPLEHWKWWHDLGFAVACGPISAAIFGFFAIHPRHSVQMGLEFHIIGQPELSQPVPK